MNSDRVWTPQNTGMLAGIFVASGWIAAGITLLNLAGRVVMSLGGFVASGGPYAIAHPAPGWIPMVPAAIVSSAFMALFSVWLANRTGGFSLLPFLWCGLFVTLGIQFAVFGLHPPATAKGGIAWGWLLCAAFFIPMGLAPAVLRKWLGDPTAIAPDASRVRPARESAAYRTAYSVCVIAGAAAGMAAGFAIFRAVAG
jgi:hypothetical protein